MAGGNDYPRLVIADARGRVFSHPYLRMVGRSGNRLILPDPSELIPLPEGSQLFTMPGRIAVGWDPETNSFVRADRAGKACREFIVTAVAAFLPPGFVRTLLPAAEKQDNAPALPLWSYCSVGWKRGRFWTTAIHLDPNPHWNPTHFRQEDLLRRRIAKILRDRPRNRLFQQLSRCALEYRCFAAMNVFYRRWECPLPTSPTCNARCLGCISLQPSECCPASQERITFIPTEQEILEVAVPHLTEAEDAIVSFGQGCEGEPLMNWRVLEKSIRRMREKTDRGTINLNTNGSFPSRVAALCDAGLDSIRVTLGSPDPERYRRYHRPVRYGLDAVVASLVEAKGKGVYTSINLLVMPGLTDTEDELEKLIELIRKTDIDLVQMRNLNIDPDLYFETMGGGEGIGIPNMIKILKREFPELKFGYFNRTRNNFFKDSYPLS